MHGKVYMSISSGWEFRDLYNNSYTCDKGLQVSLPRAHAQGVKQSSVVVVVVVVGTKIARSRVLGICARCKHNQSVDIGEKLVYMRFELLKKAY